MATVSKSKRDQPEVADPQVTLPELGFFRLVYSDYLMHYRYRREGRRRALALFPLRFLLNPSLHFALLVRLAQRGPRFLLHPLHWLQVVMFSSEVFTFDVEPGIVLGPAVDFPHPYGVMIGPGTVIGSRVSIYHHTMIGTNRRWFPGDELRAPTIGDDAVIGGSSRVLGPYRIGERAVIGLDVLVDRDVPAGATLLLSGLKPEGEWDDPRRDGREAMGPDIA
jgi:serine acetyltransferase